MTRSLAICAFSLGMLVVSASHCRGGFNVVPGDIVKLDKVNVNGSPGGIFNVNVVGRGTAVDFQTMCVELTEHISLNTEYYVDNVGPTTNLTGKTLVGQAAYLYTQANLGTLALTSGFFTFSTATTDQANALQLGIWQGLNPAWPRLGAQGIETLAGWSAAYIDNTLMPILNPWLTAFGSSGWTGTGTVQIMNLQKFVAAPANAVGLNIRTLADGSKIELKEYNQDQLVIGDPPGTPLTPELPSFCTAASLIACGALCGLVTQYRKRKVSPSVA